MTIDVEAIKSRTNLLELVEQDVSMRLAARTRGGEWWGPCPFCGQGNDRFHVWPLQGRFWCRVCDRKGDALTYVAERHSLDLTRGEDFQRACELLGAPVSFRTGDAYQPLPRSRSEANVRPAVWQANSRKVIAACANVLWTPAGRDARAWLNNRGLQDDTMRYWRIGYNPGTSSRTLHGLQVPCGILIPGVVDNHVWYLKIRRRTEGSRYVQVTGSQPALYMAKTLAGRKIVVLTEGELDALLLWQEARDIAGIATLGSASVLFDDTLWGGYLAGVEHVLLAYDSDKAGQDGARKVAQTVNGAHLVRVPSLEPGDKDITDFHRRGGRLRDWLQYHIVQHYRPQPPASERQKHVVSSIPNGVLRFA